MTDEKRDLLPTSTPSETILDITGMVGSLAPGIGGPIGQVLAGISSAKRLERIREVIAALVAELQGFESEVSTKYLKTDDFPELLEKTLRQAADERHSSKRKIYALFLADAIKSPANPYDAQIKFLRTLEELQADHLRLIKALMAHPSDQVESGFSGSIGRTLQRRLPDIAESTIHDLVEDTNRMGLTKVEGWGVTMTARGAEHLQNMITPYGKRFVTFLQIAPI